MPVKNSRMKYREVKTYRIDFGDDGDLNVEYYPNALTLNLQKKVQAAAKENDLQTIADEFFKVVKTWDVQDDDGNVLPINRESLSDLGIRTLNEIIEQLAGNENPNPVTSTS